MTKGWIKFHRGWLDHWLYNENRPKTRREAWEDMLLLVNHSPQEVALGNAKYLCGRGQSVRSLESWAKQFKWTKSKVKRFFDFLVKDEMISIENLYKSTRITICYYDTYVDQRNEDETQVKQKGNKDDSQVIPNNNEKKKKNDKNEKDLNAQYFLNNKKIKDGDIYVQEL